MSDRDNSRSHRPEPDEIDPDAPATAEEVAASQRLRDALDGGAAGSSPELDLAMALRAAWEPGALSTDESRAVLDAVPTAEEQALATSLREALETRREPAAAASADVVLAHALRSAFAPAALDEAAHRAIVDAALAKMPARVVSITARSGRGRAVRIALGVVTGGLALAASIVLVVTSAPHGTEAPLAKARTTQPLFSEPFKPGEASARIDRIASARASDFRDNRFSKWGVR